MGKDKAQKPKVGSNKAMMDRRLNTSPLLTFRWHSLSFGCIALGLFVILNFFFYIAMEAGGLPRYLGIFSCVRIPNDYDPSVIRRIYYVDGRVVTTLFVPGVFFFVMGCAMQLLRIVKLKHTVAAEVKRGKEEQNSSI